MCNLITKVGSWLIDPATFLSSKAVSSSAAQATGDESCRLSVQMEAPRRWQMVHRLVPCSVFRAYGRLVIRAFCRLSGQP